MALAAGDRLGPYEILAPLGAGGMGEVYRGTDTKLGREVAIKTLPPEVTGDSDRLARFQREAHLLASLNHTNIAAIYGLEEADGKPFLVLELVEGEDLQQRLQRGAIPVDEALEIARQIAEGLEAAHEKGIVHRDLKPANVKLTPDGKVKVLDFGLAKAWAGDRDSVTGSSSGLSQSPTLAHSGTQAGVILGTAAYMSPEQARGKPVDKRADIWGFGVVLFEMLTGKRLFSGDEVSDMLASILKEEPDWTLLPADTPRRLSDLLHRCLRKDARSRLRDIGDARIEIEEARSEPTGGVLEPAKSLADRPGWRRAVPWVFAALATALAAWSLLRPAPREAQSVARTSIVLPPGEPLALGTNKSAVAISPDGSRLAWVAAREDTGSHLYLRGLDQVEATPLLGTEGAESPFFSPDGQWVGFFARGELKKISVTGGAAITLCDSQGISGGTWAPDDTIIFGGSAAVKGLRRISAGGGTPEVLTSPDVTRGHVVHAWPEILPGGKAVLYSVHTADAVTADDALIAVLSLDTGEDKLLLQGGDDPRYAPTGHLIYARAGSLRAVKFDLDRLEVTEPSLQVLAGVRTNQEDGAPLFEFSRNGTLVYVRGGPQPDRTLVWVNRQGDVSAITQDERGYLSPRLSPDGQRIAVLVGWMNHNVWIYDLTRGTFSPLTHQWDNHSPVWTHDGQRVVFDSTRSPPRGVFWRSADGSGAVEPLQEADQVQIPTSISPDGEVLALMQLHSSRGMDILLHSMDGASEPREFLATEVDEANPTFSPDGRSIAYQSTETGQWEVYVRPFPGPGASLRISTEGGGYPAWAPSGRELFYRDGDKMMAVAVETKSGFSTGSPRLLFAGRFTSEDYDISTDGEQFLMIREPETEPVTQLQVVFNWFEELQAKMREAEE